MENNRSFSTTIWIIFDSDGHGHVFKTHFRVKFAGSIKINCLVYITTILRLWRGQVMSEPLLLKTML